jgi:hypothetical protein
LTLIWLNPILQNPDWKLFDDRSVKTLLYKVITAPFYLGATTSSSDHTHELDDYIKFNETRHVAPEYQILDVTSDAEETAWLIGLSGKIIETLEIDGSTVAQADPTESTANQNHQQGESLVPTRYTIHGMMFHLRSSATALVSARERTDNVSDDRVVCSTHLYDRTTVILPTSTVQIRDATPPTGLPGIIVQPNVNWLSRFQYFFGFRASDRMNHDNRSDRIPHMPLARLYVFSPYMYTGYEDHKSANFSSSLQKSYWVTNLRTHFGSDKLLLDATHPFKAHPLI